MYSETEKVIYTARHSLRVLSSVLEEFSSAPIHVHNSTLTVLTSFDLVILLHLYLQRLYADLRIRWVDLSKGKDNRIRFKIFNSIGCHVLV